MARDSDSGRLAGLWDTVTMQAAYELRDCTPSPVQRCLLQASLGDGDSALRAWQAWRKAVDLDVLDPASFRLLPIAYRNMTALGQDDALLQRLKGIYRHSWYRNQILYRQAAGVLEEFERAGLPALLLKGAALSERFYGDVGIRFMNDVDIMVRKTDYEQAAELLLRAQWKPALYSAETMFWYHRQGFKHGCGFKRDNVELDLHSCLLRFVPDAKESLWQDAVAGSWQGRAVHFLSDTDQLFHTCVHGLRWSYAYLSWIPDALVILRHERTRIDWKLLVDRAEQSRAIPFLHNALAFLIEEFQAPIPPTVMSRLDSLATSWIERQEYQVLGETATRHLSYQARRALVQSCRYQAMRRGRQGAINVSLMGWLRFFYVHLHQPGRSFK